MGRPMKFEADAAIDRAMEVFWRRGYAGTTPQALVDELGIGKGSFYNTFESKHGLFTLALERYKDNRIAYLRDTLEPEGPLRDRLDAAMRELTGVGRHQQGCLMVNATAELTQTDEAVAAIADSLFTGIESAFRDAIERGQSTGEFTGVQDAQHAAASLLTTLIGSSILLKMGTDPERAIGAMRDAVLAL
ncbi:TetR/AcrR family transcriptional regulator [Leifsonia poae]|uniref:TetR/AcrR family transcriptional regulator n=1 Tax=Leifsonia poae TaxID=110933 RepID=UPI003D67079A